MDSDGSSRTLLTPRCLDSQHLLIGEEPESVLPHNTQDVHLLAKHVERVGVVYGVHIVSSWTGLESSEPYQHVVLTTGSGSTSNHPHDSPRVPVVRDEDILRVHSPADNIRIQQKQEQRRCLAQSHCQLPTILACSRAGHKASLARCSDGGQQRHTDWRHSMFSSTAG